MRSFRGLALFMTVMTLFRLMIAPDTLMDDCMTTETSCLSLAANRTHQTSIRPESPFSLQERWRIRPPRCHDVETLSPEVLRTDMRSAHRGARRLQRLSHPLERCRPQISPS